MSKSSWFREDCGKSVAMSELEILLGHSFFQSNNEHMQLNIPLNFLLILSVYFQEFASRTISTNWLCVWSKLYFPSATPWKLVCVFNTCLNVGKCATNQKTLMHAQKSLTNSRTSYVHLVGRVKFPYNKLISFRPSIAHPEGFTFKVKILSPTRTVLGQWGEPSRANMSTSTISDRITA